MSGMYRESNFTRKLFREISRPSFFRGFSRYVILSHFRGLDNLSLNLQNVDETLQFRNITKFRLHFG